MFLLLHKDIALVKIKLKIVLLKVRKGNTIFDPSSFHSFQH